MKIKNIFSIGCCSFLLLAGCATRNLIKVDSISQPHYSENSFYLVPADGIKTDDLRYQEFARIARNGLVREGFVPEANSKQAELKIILSYGLGTPQVMTRSSSVPVYSYAPVTTPIVDSNGKVIGTALNQQPSGPTGYDVSVNSTLEYEKYIVLTAYQANPPGKNSEPAMVWQTKITTNDESTDLRRKFPIMIFLSKGLIGNDSHGEKVIDANINYDDPKVQLLINREWVSDKNAHKPVSKP